MRVVPLRWRLDVPQGLLEKIQIQLLLTDLALQLGNLAPGLRQLRRAFRAVFASQQLGLRSPATMTRKVLLRFYYETHQHFDNT